MATLYFVKDGPRPGNSREIKFISSEQAESLSANKRVIYLGQHQPEFNAANPSMYEIHVVVEIFASDDPSSEFNKTGFYIIDNLKPETASALVSHV